MNGALEINRSQTKKIIELKKAEEFLPFNFFQL